MQSALFIQSPQLSSDAFFPALAERFALNSTPHIAQARAMLQPGQLIVLSLVDIHDHEPIYFLRELVLASYKVVAILPQAHAPLQRVCALLGAHSMVENNCDAGELLRSIEMVQSGQRTYPSEFLSSAIAFYYDSLPPLSRSGMAILNAFFKQPQASNLDLAKLVCLSEGSIRNNFTKLYKKFNVQSRHEVINATKQHGYFVGLNLVFPRGFNMHVNEVKIVDGKK